MRARGAELGWGHEALSDPRAERVWRRLASLRESGLTLGMVVRDFLVVRTASLQRHSQPMWTLSKWGDPMCLQRKPLPPETLHKMLLLLVGEVPGVCSAYATPLCLAPVSGRAYAEKMPRFDAWGLLPEGISGPRDNPLEVVPGLTSPSFLRATNTSGGAPDARSTPSPDRAGGARVSPAREADGVGARLAPEVGGSWYAMAPEVVEGEAQRPASEVDAGEGHQPVFEVMGDADDGGCPAPEAAASITKGDADTHRGHAPAQGASTPRSPLLSLTELSRRRKMRSSCGPGAEEDEAGDAEQVCALSFLDPF